MRLDYFLYIASFSNAFVTSTGHLVPVPYVQMEHPFQT